ncbi:adenosylcobyric acid synthase (glutamine-hydrolysing) [Clostridium cavendishii DSM 21758]|uniref:Cobyric acid synthase n=1 Tax=Clostridium cavendishii DSM 21758 TaxID=1121302 RepID=A0A1M6T9B3_9CLOT|nr:cobyric acid synthase [Clostridium cavendishii]SHK53338.1 adenosylcobyric acid synthase (glutamine-hydrolysing) [Clostridium cavendishii DSM 21758]
MKAKSIMLQGTGSTVGKSILCVALCKIFAEKGLKVTPFKSQNMSLNSGVTPEGEEMGRAQVMQAEAAGVAPSAKMNPILLKPTSDRASQIVLLGKVWNTLDAVNYFDIKKELKSTVEGVYRDIEKESEVIVIEGAGSPAEINLSDEFVNMGMAKIAKSPVILVGDIDKGGVFASLYGTVMLLPEDERKLIKGFIINKFRGSIELLEPGLKQIEDLTGIPVLGVVPYFNLELEDEDSVVDFNKFTKEGALKVGVIKLPYMSNFTDFNSLALNKGVSLSFIDLNESLEDYHLIILPGSKSTLGDLKALKESGMDEKIKKAAKGGKFVFGICGGYQILGKTIIDKAGVETSLKEDAGLGLLDIETEFINEKETVISKGRESLFNTEVTGYEIHMGRTKVNKNSRHFISQDKEEANIDGNVDSEGRIIGTYYHGIFDNGEFTLRYLNMIREKFNIPLETEIINYLEHKNEEYHKLADIVRESLDMEKIHKIMEEGV